MVYTDAHCERFFSAIGQAEMCNDPRFCTFAARMVHIDEVCGILSDIFLTRTTTEWLALLEEADVPVMPMHDFESVLNDPHLVATQFFRSVDHPTEGRLRQMSIPTKWSRTIAEPSRPAPRHGEHGSEILQEVGFSPADIAELAEQGVLCGVTAAAKPVREI